MLILVCCTVHTSIRNTNFLTVSGLIIMLTKNIGDIEITLCTLLK